MLLTIVGCSSLASNDGNEERCIDRVFYGGKWHCITAFLDNPDIENNHSTLIHDNFDIKINI